MTISYFSGVLFCSILYVLFGPFIFYMAIKNPDSRLDSFTQRIILLMDVLALILLPYMLILEPLRESQAPFSAANILISADSSIGLLLVNIIIIPVLSAIILFSAIVLMKFFGIFSEKIFEGLAIIFLFIWLIFILLAPVLTICYIAPWISNQDPYCLPTWSFDLWKSSLHSNLESLTYNPISYPAPLSTTLQSILAIFDLSNTNFTFQRFTNAIIILGNLSAGIVSVIAIAKFLLGWEKTKKEDK